jgi:oxygen-dependent protoporphyrinogen oxidase
VSERRVLVVGAGITGLAAAIELIDDAKLHVEVWEADERVGGKLATSPFAGIDRVDEGADAYLVRVPHAVDFARRVGLTEHDLTSPAPASAMVWHHGLHEIPDGVMLGVPTSIAPFASTSLLSWRGKLRAAVEPLLPRTDPDDALGRLVRARFGDEVHERLVDALIGSIYATDTDRSSLAAVPQLASLHEQHRSLLIGARAARRGAGPSTGVEPIFAAPAGGMAALVDAAERTIVGAGGRLSLDRPVTAIERDGARVRVDDELFDGVVLAVPASVASRLLTRSAPSSAEQLSAFEVADVIMVRLAVSGGDWPDRLVGHSGYLVPKPVQRNVTAASFGSQKWSHWRPGDDRQILRVSLGRDGLPVMHLDDDSVRAAVVEEVGEHLDLDLRPDETSITRWHAGFPQYRPHHVERVASVEAALPSTIALAGASYRGIGVPACIADGRRAAQAIKESMHTADGFLA